MMLIFLQCAAIVVLIALSAFFSGSETGFYRMSRFRLRLGVEQKLPFYATLAILVRNGKSLILAILIGNNLVNYLLTYLVTLLVFQNVKSQHLAEFYSTAILTPLIFVFGEMVPKVLFYHWADVLVPRLTWLLWFVYRVFTVTGAIAVLAWFSNTLTRLLGLQADTAVAVETTQQNQVFQIIHETREEGLLSDLQREMIERLLHIPTVTAQSLMVPFPKVEKVGVQTSGPMLLEHLKKTSRTRQVVVNKDGAVCGYILIYEVLGGRQDFAELHSFVKPIVTLEPTSSVIDAMNALCQKREKIALIQQAKQPLGIITLTDLVEELTGELAAS